MLLKLESWINCISDFLGKVSSFLFVLLLFNVFFDVVMRYAFNEVSIGMQEMEWHLYASVFMLAIPYTLRSGGHVRVDVIYEGLSKQKRAWVDIIGVLVFLFPFTLLVFWYGIGFTHEAYTIDEGSGDPGGLPYRWVIKSVIPLAFSLMALSGLGLLLRSVNVLRGYHLDEDDPETGIRSPNT